MAIDRLNERVALITGAGSGIGRASALRMASEGAAVMCADLNAEGAQTTAAQIAEHGGRSATMELDVTSEDAVQDALAQTVAVLGGLDVIFNNAGIGGAQYSWDQTIDVNLTGVYYGTYHGAGRAGRARRRVDHQHRLDRRPQRTRQQRLDARPASARRAGRGRLRRGQARRGRHHPASSPSPTDRAACASTRSAPATSTRP